MTKTINASTVSVQFTAEAYKASITGLVKACTSIDKAAANAAPAIALWCKVSAAGISANSITLDDVATALLARFPKVDKVSNLPAAIRGQWFSFSRVIKAGAGDRLIAGEALNTVRAECKAVQEQTTGKRGSNSPKNTTSKAVANPKAELISLNTAIASVRHHIKLSMANGEQVTALAASPELAGLFADILALSKAAEKGVAKPAKAKPVRAKAPKAIPSANVVAMAA